MVSKLIFSKANKDGGFANPGIADDYSFEEMVVLFNHILYNKSTKSMPFILPHNFQTFKIN